MLAAPRTGTTTRTGTTALWSAAWMVPPLGLLLVRSSEAGCSAAADATTSSTADDTFATASSTAAAPPETHTFPGVQITILRRHSATMPDELTVDDVKAMLDDGGFEGNLESITFVNEASQLPQNPHERILLLDVVRVLFNSAGADGGETIGASDLGEWIARHRLDGATELVDAATEIAQAGRRITFDDFKALLTRSKLLSFQRERGTDGYGVHPSLVRTTAGVFFQHADSNHDEKVSREGLARMFKAHGLGDAARAERYFERFDLDKSGELDKKEFTRLLLGLKMIDGDGTDKLTKEDGASACVIL